MARRDPPDVRQLYSVRVDDAELVRLAASGDRDAWARSTTATPIVCTITAGPSCAIGEAEDALHDAFVAAAQAAALCVAALIVAGAAFFALRPTTAPVSATGSGPSLTLAAAPSASATPGTHRHCPFAWADSYCYCCDPGGCAGRHRVAHRRDRLRGYVNGSVAAVPQHRWQRTLVDAFVAGCSHCSFCRVGFAGQRRSCQRRPDSRSGRAH